MSHANVWLIVGLSGQALFTARFLVQWLASERMRDSVIPVAFWWLSLAGGMTLLAYAVFHLKDPVITLGQGTGLIVYVRNLMLVGKGRRRAAERPGAMPRPHATAGFRRVEASRPDESMTQV